MRKISIISLTFLLIAAFSYAATNSTTHSTTKTSSSKSSSTKFEGTVQKVDSATHTVMVQVGTDTKTFKYSSKAMWTKDGKKVKMMDLKEGDKIDVYSDSKNFARRIEASPHTS